MGLTTLGAEIYRQNNTQTIVRTPYRKLIQSIEFESAYVTCMNKCRATS